MSLLKQYRSKMVRDCRQEAEALWTVRDEVWKGGFEREVVIPRPFWEYTTDVGSHAISSFESSIPYFNQTVPHC